MSPTATTAPILAAGAVCWRLVEGTISVLLVHRAFRADVSLPKGKVDPGEMLPETAVREIKEETGLTVALGVPLGSIDYLIGGRKKIVTYWAAEVSQQAIVESTFKPNDEIGALQWMSLKKARKELTYERDIEVLDRFAALVERGSQRTFPVVVLRHGKALPPADWDGPDDTRPLMHRGLLQAERVARLIPCWAPETVVTSSAARCVSTVGPLTRAISVNPVVTPLISQVAYESGRARVAQVVREQLRPNEGVVLCAHGPVIPEIVAEVAAQTGSPISPDLRRVVGLGTGAFMIIHLSKNRRHRGIVAVEHYSTGI